MVRLIKIVGVLGFILCLMIMYFSNHGIRGIQKYDHSFRLLDMRFHYNGKLVYQTFEQISSEGRIAYQKYLALDFIFIVFFLVTMIILTEVAIASLHVRTFLYILCGLRAMFDVIENILLLNMLGRYPVFNENLAALCSWFTTFKFIMLYIWLLSIACNAIINHIKSLS